MLQLKYTMQKDKFQTVTVLGDPSGIRNLYWQLKRNYACNDGTCIGDIRVLNFDGEDVTETVMCSPWQSATRLSNLDE